MVKHKRFFLAKTDNSEVNWCLPLRLMNKNNKHIEPTVTFQTLRGKPD